MTITLVDHVSATVFWSYIAAALYLSVKSIKTLRNIQPDTNGDPRDIRGRTWPFIVLAVVAFSALSFNMLGILVQSFQQWSHSRVFELSLQSLAKEIWQWSLDTKPFTRFILDIFADETSLRTSIVALISTLLLSLYMGTEGRRHDIPDLWAFFGLAQILPISFASSLLFIGILRRGRPSAIIEPSYALMTTISASFAGCIAQAVYLVSSKPDSAWLLPIVALARLILLTPLLFKPQPSSSASTHLHRDLLTLLIVISSLTAAVCAKDIVNTDWHQMLEYVVERPAASTLSCDLFLTAIVCTLWQYGTSHEA